MSHKKVLVLYVSRRGSRFRLVYFYRIFSNFTIPLISSVLLQVCDNCTTIVRERATDFEIVRVRVREKFFVREHLYKVTPVSTMLVSPGGTNQSRHAKIV